MSKYVDKFRGLNGKAVIIPEADHNFSGEQFDIFLDAPVKYLFGKNR